MTRWILSFRPGRVSVPWRAASPFLRWSSGVAATGAATPGRIRRRPNRGPCPFPAARRCARSQHQLTGILGHGGKTLFRPAPCLSRRPSRRGAARPSGPSQCWPWSTVRPGLGSALRDRQVRRRSSSTLGFFPHGVRTYVRRGLFPWRARPGFAGPPLPWSVLPQHSGVPSSRRPQE